MEAGLTCNLLPFGFKRGGVRSNQVSFISKRIANAYV